MVEGRIFHPSEIDDSTYEDLAAAYKQAFAGWPWFEDHDTVDIRRSFDDLRDSMNAAWYIERFAGSGQDTGVTLGALAIAVSPGEIAEKKYSDVPEMNEALTRILGDRDRIVWLDEVFANPDLRDEGNLDLFGDFVSGLAERLGQSTVAYRTRHPAMTHVAWRDFREDATILRGNSSGVPDERDVVVINLRREG